MNIQEVISLKRGIDIRRKEWPVADYVFTIDGEKLRKMDRVVAGSRLWTPTIADLVADDWEVVQ